MVKLIQVIQAEECRGRGIESDPLRRVTQYWTPDGKLLAEADPIPPLGAPCRDLLTDIMRQIKSIRVGGTVDDDTERVLRAIFDTCRDATAGA